MSDSNERNAVIRSPRRKMRLGDRVLICGRPALSIKSGKNQDVVTAEEIVEAIYGKKVERIIFKKETE